MGGNRKLARSSVALLIDKLDESNTYSPAPKEIGGFIPCRELKMYRAFWLHCCDSLSVVTHCLVRDINKTLFNFLFFVTAVSVLTLYISGGEISLKC